MEDAPEKAYQREVNGSEEDIKFAQQIVTQELGSDYNLEYGEQAGWPKNVGVKGDEGILGDTVAITSNIPENITILLKDHELAQRVAGRLAMIEAITKVLVVYSAPKKA